MTQFFTVKKKNKHESEQMSTDVLLVDGMLE